ncbi:heterokaryon incompatibility protein het-E-1 [Fusarium mundagurra]|uniref:Heterokaryon incompatibility protein het-E-1 n=1 Tax=Fusarium mundagurra TaxID=1567541 RepID=A0A8H5XUM6_9HYPO|nr:heterokaryon incompatibility protein het-E-1 [Fusarium mundagurra]
MVFEVKPAGKAPTELSRLWRDAFEAYNDTVGEKGLKLDLDGGHLITSLADVAVHFIGKNLDYAQRIGDQIASSAAASFPPASAIWTVATYAIKAFQAQSKDYDQLLSLIGEAGSFLKTLQIIEDNFPHCDCDAKLSAAYGDVTTAISRLSRANGLMAVRNTEDIKTLVGSLGEKVDFIHEEMMVYFQDQGKRIEAGFDLQELNFQQQSASLASIQCGIRELKSQLAQDTNAATAARPTTDGVTGKLVALNIAKHFFGTPPSPLAEFKELRRSFVPGTDSWLYENKKYQEWQDGDTNFLWITSEPGLGKTHLPYSIIESLRTKTNKDPQTSVAYYFFQQENEPFSSVRALRAECPTFILRSGPLNIWLWTIDKLYKEETNDRLFFIIDSLEQANPAQARELLAFTEGIVDLKQKIKVVFTGNDFEELSTWREYVDKDLAIISIDPSAARSGMQKLLESRFESLPRLSKFSNHVKAEIAKAIAEGKYAFAERPLTLEEAYSLLELNFRKLIDLETEIAGRCSRASNVEGPSDHKVGIVASRDKYQPDSSLLLHFQENTIRDYMLSADVPNSTLQMSPLLSHVDIFTTCTEVLCSPEELGAPGNADARQTLQSIMQSCYDDFNDKGVSYFIQLWIQKALECSPNLLGEESKPAGRGDNDAFEEDDIASCEYQLTSTFEDIVVGQSDYRAIGLTLLSAWTFDALEAFNESLELCETDIDKFATLAAMAKCHHGIADHDDDAYDTACKSLALDRSVLGKEYDDLLHTALLVWATYESGHNMLEAAVESLQEAITVYSGDRRKTAEDFSMLLCTLDKLGRHEDILASIVKWGPVRLAVTAENRAEVNIWYQKAAKQTGQEQVMMLTYELLVQELAPLDWASPTRYQYALGCRRSIGDRAKAKSLLYEVLDTDNCIDPATDAVSYSIPCLARRELAEIICEQFLQATSSAQKRASLFEIEGLAGRKLGNAHLTSDVQSNFPQRPEATILARMYRRFGPLEKFEETLTDVFNNCLASLKD